MMPFCAANWLLSNHSAAQNRVNRARGQRV